MNRSGLFLHLMLLIFLWFFMAGIAGALEAGPVSQLHEAPSLHAGPTATLFAQGGDGNSGGQDPVDIHRQYDDRGYAPEVPTPAPGEGEPYDDGPNMDRSYGDDAPNMEVPGPEEDRPYGDDAPDMEVPGPEGGSIYPGSPPEDQGFDPDAGPGGFDDGSLPSAGEPYGEEGAYPSDDGGMPQQGVAPGDENEGAYGEGPGDDRIYDEDTGEEMPPEDIGYDEGASESGAGRDEYAPAKRPVKKHHKKTPKKKKSKKINLRDLGLYLPPDFVP